MRAFLFLILSLPLFAHGVTISQQKLWKKISNPIPKWMQEQIDEDLSAFKESGITKEMIDKTMDEVYALPTGRGAQFVRYQIKDNKVTYYTPSENPSDVRVAHFIKFIELLAEHAELPDIDFIMSLWDSYDRPLFLEKTQCPIFTMCRLKPNHKGVLFPEVRYFDGRETIFNNIARSIKSVPWEKKIEKAYWRGGTTGGYYPLYEWDYRPRPRLVLFAKDHPNLIDAYFTYPYWIDNNLKMTMESYGLFSGYTSQIDWIDYKYLIAVDGNTFASSFWWELLSNCTVIKGDSDYIEWFYKGVEPWVHYVPYDQDCSDLEEKLLWVKTHDKEARKIAENAYKFAENNLSTEDMLLYFYSVFHAYAKLQK